MGLPPDKVTVLISGTQGEPMSALSRVAVDNHKHISVDKGDTVVLSSRIIPGNEKAIFRMIDHMARRGADVLYGSMNPPLHVSGHGSVEELRLVLNLVRPRYFMPIHGEYRQLAKHARLAEHLRFAGLEETFVLETGAVLEIDQHGARKAGKVTVGRVCIDSGSVDDVVEDMVIRDRRHLSEDGIVLPIIAINSHTGAWKPRPKSSAAASPPPWTTIPNSCRWPRQIVAKTLEGSNREEKTDWGVMKEKIRADLKRYIVKETRAAPYHAGNSGGMKSASLFRPRAERAPAEPRASEAVKESPAQGRDGRSWRAHSCAPHPDSSGCPANTRRFRGSPPGLATSGGVPSGPGTHQCVRHVGAPMIPRLLSERPERQTGCLTGSRFCGRRTPAMRGGSSLPLGPLANAHGSGGGAGNKCLESECL